MFETGEVYCGQAVDVVRRYAQHVKNHTDVVGIAFKEITAEKLDDEERFCIESLEEMGWPLRNVTFTSLPKGESRFDSIMSLDDQSRWLNDVSFRPRGASRPENADVRRKHAGKFKRLLQNPKGNEAVRVLAAYIDAALPIPETTELDFWAVSCVLERRRDLCVLSRVNLNMQEVMTFVEDDGQLWTTWHCAKSPLAARKTREYRNLRRLARRLKLNVDDHRYTSGGPDQVSLTVCGASAAIELIEDPSVLRAIRLMNLRLMKKGPTYYGRTHCFDLAGAAYRILNETRV